MSNNYKQVPNPFSEGLTISCLDDNGNYQGFIWRESQGWSYDNHQKGGCGQCKTKDEAWNKLLEVVKIQVEKEATERKAWEIKLQSLQNKG
jgi:hypothetical protein